MCLPRSLHSIQCQKYLFRRPFTSLLLSLYSIDVSFFYTLPHLTDETHVNILTITCKACCALQEITLLGIVVKRMILRTGATIRSPFYQQLVTYWILRMDRHHPGGCVSLVNIRDHLYQY